MISLQESLPYRKWATGIKIMISTSSVQQIFHWWYSCIHWTKKWSFPLKVFSVNVTKSAGNCGFRHIYWEVHNWKLQFFWSVVISMISVKLLYSDFTSLWRWHWSSLSLVSFFNMSNLSSSFDYFYLFQGTPFSGCFPI